MKIKHLIIVSLILAVLTIGAVSASEDTDDLMAMGDTEDTVISSVESEEVISDGGEDIDVPEDAKEIDMKVTDVPKTIKYGESITCNVNITNEDAEGTLYVYVDDSEDYNDYDVDGPFDEECESIAGITKFGNHILHIKYTGDDNYADKLMNFTFTVEDYYLSIGETDAIFGSEYKLYINVPDGTYGEFIVTCNGVDYKCIVEYLGDEDCFVTIPANALKYGTNNVTIHYVPNKDSEFGEKTLNASFNCIAEITGPDSDFYYEFGEVDEIVLLLPSDAKGNLSVKINGEEYKNIALVNGKASLSLNDLICGNNYEFEASYTGDDYTVEDYSANFVDINPKVEIPEYVYSGVENFTIVITLPSSVNGSLTVSKNNDVFYTNSSASGIITLSTKTEDSNIIVIYEEGEYLFENSYDVEVRDENPKFEMNITADEKVLKGNSISLEINIPSDIVEDIDGTFTLYIDGVKVKEEAQYYSHYSLYYDTESLSLGTHTWKIEFSDDEYFTAEAKSGSFEVIYIEFDIPTNITIRHDSTGSIGYISLPNDATGIVTLLVDGKEHDSDFVVNGMGYVYLGDVAAGKHDIEVKYEGNYPAASQKSQLTVDYEFVIYCVEEEFAYGEPVKIIAHLPEYATGNVVFTVGDKKYTVAAEDGYAIVTINDLAEGNYTVFATYQGDSKYPSKTVNDTFEVSGFAIILPDFEDDEMYYGEDKVITLTLPSNATGTLFVKLDDEEYKNVTLVNGKASISLKDVAPGTYSLVASYNGTDYDVKDQEMDLTVGILMDYTDEIEINGNGWLYLKLPGDVKGNITIDMGELGKQNLTPNNGIINFTLPAEKFGEYSFTLTYTGDDYPGIKFEEYDDEIDEMTLMKYYVSVTPIKLTIPDEDASNDNKITFTLPEDAKGKVSIYENDEGEYALVTQVNVTGPNVSISLDMLKPGNYDLMLVYEDEKYGNFTMDMNYMPISKPTPSISISASGNDKSEIFTFELPKTATGGLMVKIAGTSYYAPIKDGLATLTVNNLNSGDYNISVSYYGDENYSYAEASKIITVASSIPAKIVAKDLAVQYTAGSKYTVTVYAEGGALASNVNVVIKINGKKVATVKTNAKGVATYTVVQAPGTYKITAEALGKTITKKLTVKHIVKLQKVKVKRSAKKLVIKVTLSKVNGKYIKGKKVTLKFKGKTYKVKTNKKGVAKFTIKKNVLKKLKAGKKVTYQATYLKDTVKKTVKVKK